MDELKNQCKFLGVKNYSKLKKDDMIKTISERKDELITFLVENEKDKVFKVLTGNGNSSKLENHIYFCKDILKDIESRESLKCDECKTNHSYRIIIKEEKSYSDIVSHTYLSIKSKNNKEISIKITENRYPNGSDIYLDGLCFGGIYISDENGSELKEYMKEKYSEDYDTIMHVYESLFDEI